MSDDARTDEVESLTGDVDALFDFFKARVSYFKSFSIYRSAYHSEVNYEIRVWRNRRRTLGSGLRSKLHDAIREILRQAEAEGNK